MTLSKLLHNAAIRYEAAVRACLQECPHQCQNACENCLLTKIREQAAQSSKNTPVC